jgi:phosphate transport system permease protein
VITGRASGFGSRLFEGALLLCAALSVFVTAAIVFVLIDGARAFFAAVPLLDFVFGREWTPLFSTRKFGVLPLVAGTLLTSFVALAFALPAGLLAAAWLSEFASPRVRRVLKPLIETLGGIPSIVFGYLALVLLTPALQRFVPNLAGFSALSAGLAMGIMILPMWSSLAEDALAAVPRGLREAALGVGASPVMTLLSVTLPAARSGLVAAALLTLARAVGETMIVAIAAGQQPRLTADPRVPIETMTAYIVQISMGDTPRGTIEYDTLFAVGASLFVLTFVINASAQALLRRSQAVAA